MNSITKTFKLLELIFIILFAFQLLLALFFYILRDMQIIEFDFFDYEYLPIILLIINTTCILFAKYIFTARNQIDIKLSINQKLTKYRDLSLIIIVILDFANVTNLIFFLLTGSQTYLLVAILVLILYTVYRPVKEKFINTTLTPEEKSHSKII